MFIVELTYKVPLDQIDQYLEEHVAFLQRQYAAKHFLASGPKVPRNGGIILSNVPDQDTLLDILKEDPFQIHDLAEYRILQFIPRMVAKELAFLVD
ncbi:MAG: YciI family protein [Bacteroidota bacterium]